MKIITYCRGQVLGSYGVKYLKESDPVFYKSKKTSVLPDKTIKIRRAVFQCPLCPNDFTANIPTIKEGRIRSCGCIVRTQNGLSCPDGKRSRIYSIWRAMKNRCNKKNNENFHWYGANKISVCKEWDESFLCFHCWAISNGYDDSLEIDRINNNGNYEPTNCRFVTHKDNLANTRQNKYCTLNGEKVIFAEAARRIGVHPMTITNWAKGRHRKKVPSNLVFEELI
jgi:hypothetical protein